MNSHQLLAVALATLISSGANTQELFQPTGRHTASGAQLIQYRGKMKPKQKISDVFDEWNQRHGNQCKDTHSVNVRKYEGHTYITADCWPAYQKIDYANSRIRQNITSGRFEPGFLPKLEKICHELDMHCMGLLSIMDFETGSSFSPSKRNPGNGATGLIQFTNRTARSLGYSTRTLARMSQIHQLDVVRRYFKDHAQEGTEYQDPLDIALTVFYPKAVGRGKNYVIARQGTKAYHQNAGLDDTPHDGRITAREYTREALGRGYL